MATRTEPRTFASIEDSIDDVGFAADEREWRAKRAKLGHRLHHQALKFEPETE